ncbi:hypothetical protein [Hydrogenophaga laconesensis]|uniref:DUF551 domain-containing protein n=1 Tax=Hydrogenophaga laconesensis TaxID=1805971 RepID=A0ABU1V4D3_9BURK|nr:hypothetical protein [Hydrogenophaga laconesensis]MDR7092284.1 hypothetical protein [Hydrogenophaga laconesensis]
MTTNTHIAAQLRAISEWLASQVNMEQNSYDEPPQHATEFDQRLDQAACEIGQCAQALEAAPALDAQGERCLLAPPEFNTPEYHAAVLEAVRSGRVTYAPGWNKPEIVHKAAAVANRFGVLEDNAFELAEQILSIAPPPPAVGKPLSEEEIDKAYISAYRTLNHHHSIDYFRAGVRHAEKARGIVTKETGT